MKDDKKKFVFLERNCLDLFKLKKKKPKKLINVFFLSNEPQRFDWCSLFLESDKHCRCERKVDRLHT